MNTQSCENTNLSLSEIMENIALRYATRFIDPTLRASAIALADNPNHPHYDLYMQLLNMSVLVENALTGIICESEDLLDSSIENIPSEAEKLQDLLESQQEES